MCILRWRGGDIVENCARVLCSPPFVSCDYLTPILSVLLLQKAAQRSHRRSEALPFEKGEWHFSLLYGLSTHELWFSYNCYPY